MITDTNGDMIERLDCTRCGVALIISGVLTSGSMRYEHGRPMCTDEERCLWYAKHRHKEDEKLPGAILEFTGDYAFLHNFYPSVVTVDSYDFPTVEHAMQAWRAAEESDIRTIHETIAPGAAHEYGKRIRPRDDWDAIKVDAMKMLLGQKFRPGSKLAERLLATGDAAIVYTNLWGDTYWGRSHDEGDNMLGILLMMQRTALKKLGDTDRREVWRQVADQRVMNAARTLLHDPDGTLNWQARWNGSQGLSSVIVQSGQDFTLTSVVGQVRFRQTDAATVAAMLQHAADAVREIAEG